MIKKIFIANRGEVAARIARTASSMGISSVCCSELETPPDYLKKWVSECVRVDKEDPSLYLDKKRMIAIARESSCDAVHPGFGFLSENYEFAQDVIDNHMVWIGPQPKVIEVMASKSKARQLAKSLQIPCTEGLEGITDLNKSSLKDVKTFAKKVGFPLLVKAAMGGGGKGMRLVRQMSELEQALERASSEALNSFGNASLILEQYIESSRHIEVQVIGDQFGNVEILSDRDCTFQRRHQKIIEEAPALNLSEETRQLLHECAKKLAESVDYSSLGTVEFLLDQKQTQNQKQNIYFLEMNTRLQVEHPVTEEIFNTDLVEAQIKIAEKQSLESIGFHRIKQQKLHSIEARIYGEDPSADFFPAPGRVYSFLPFYSKGVRWELGLDSQDEITPNFDPMIAKVIATASSRTEATKLLIKALKETTFFGPKNNKDFLVKLLESSEFIDQTFDTHSIAKNKDDILKNIEDEKNKYVTQVDDIIEHLSERGLEEKSSFSHFSLQDITKSSFSKKPSHLLSNHNIRVQKNSIIKDHAKGFETIHFGQGSFALDQQNLEFHFLNSKGPQGDQIWYVQISGITYQVNVQNSNDESLWTHEVAEGGISAPVPGKVIKVLAEGKHVDANSSVCIIESMKMEFEVKSPHAGHLDKVLISEGDQVEAGQVLAYLNTEN